jgi:MHS family proline/betaine transporter-like MFS transporter
VNTLSYPLSSALSLNIYGASVLIIFIPLAGKIVDKVGYGILLPVSIILLAVVTFPFLYAASAGHYKGIVGMQIVLDIPAAFYFVAMPMALIKLTHIEVRYRIISLGYNIAAALAGGTAPVISMFLVEKTGLSFAPGFYLISCALITLVIWRSNRKLIDMVT